MTTAAPVSQEGGGRRFRIAGCLGFGAVVTALFVATLWLPDSLTYPTDYPQMMLAAIAVLFFVAAGLAVRETEDATTPLERGTDLAPGGPWALAVSVVLSIIYVASWNFAGFYLSTLIFIALQLWTLGQRNPIILSAVPVATTLLVWCVFTLLLSMSFPTATLFG